MSQTFIVFGTSIVVERLKIVRGRMPSESVAGKDRDMEEVFLDWRGLDVG